MPGQQGQNWLEDQDSFELMAESFNSTSRFARLKKLQIVQAARNLYIRFVAVTGDAMGMNMISKVTVGTISILASEYSVDVNILSPCTVQW